MFSNISSFFDKYLKPGLDDEFEDSSINKIQLASAALMIELCKADQNIDEAETEKISQILREKFDLPADALEELFSLARQESAQATSLYEFTSLINEAYEHDEKIALIHNMWQVAFADGNLDHYEEHLIRKVAELLYVSHSDYIKTKLDVKNS